MTLINHILLSRLILCFWDIRNSFGTLLVSCILYRIFVGRLFTAMFSKLFNRIKNKIFRCCLTLCVWKLYEYGAQTHSHGMNLISHSNWIELIHSIADVLVRFVRYIFDFKSLFFWFDFFIVRNRMGILFMIAVNAQKETDDLQYWKILFFLCLSIFHLFYICISRGSPLDA